MSQITLKAARENAGLTQKEAAEKLKISNSTLSAWEKGTSFPTVDKATELCELYGVTINSINFLSNNSL